MTKLQCLEKKIIALEKRIAAIEKMLWPARSKPKPEVETGNGN